jgi:hypothetical protein
MLNIIQINILVTNLYDILSQELYNMINHLPINAKDTLKYLQKNLIHSLQ